MKRYFDITSWFLLFFFAPFTVLVLLSQNSIPGDIFYPVKRGLENAILAAASVSPATKVAFRADLTERRFSEAQQLLTAKADTAAFADFISEVNSTQQDLSKLSSSSEKIKNADKLIAKIDQYQIQLSQVQNQVQVAQQQNSFQQPSPVSQTPSSQQKICVQVITFARNPSSGVCQNFSTPCDVPDGWQACSISQPGTPSPSQTPTGTNQQVQPTQIPVTVFSPQPLPSQSSAPKLAPAVSSEIANNPAKGQEVKKTISNTKEELEKIKEKLREERKEEETKQKIDDERQKLKQNIEESKKSGENK